MRNSVIETVNSCCFVRYAVTEGSMKRKRWISIELEHRETTMTIRHSVEVSADAKDGQAEPVPAPPSCPVCGCTDLLPLNELLTAHSGSQADLSRALTAGELHLVTGGNELRLCQRSFESFRETRR